MKQSFIKCKREVGDIIQHGDEFRHKKTGRGESTDSVVGRKFYPSVAENYDLVYKVVNPNEMILEEGDIIEEGDFWREKTGETYPVRFTVGDRYNGLSRADCVRPIREKTEDSRYKKLWENQKKSIKIYQKSEGKLRLEIKKLKKENEALRKAFQILKHD